MNATYFFQSRWKWIVVAIAAVMIIGLVAAGRFAFQHAHLVSAESISALTPGQVAAIQGAEVVLFQPDTTSWIFLPAIER